MKNNNSVKKYKKNKLKGSRKIKGTNKLKGTHKIPLKMVPYKKKDIEYNFSKIHPASIMLSIINS